jgi:hypothetical protein
MNKLENVGDILDSTPEGVAFGRGLLLALDGYDPAGGEGLESEAEISAFARGLAYGKLGYDPGAESEDYLSFLVLMSEIYVEAA